MRIPSTLSFVGTLVILVGVLTLPMVYADTVTITLVVVGLPSGVQTKVYLNGTNPWVDGRQLAANSSSPLKMELQKGSIISIALDSQISDSLGNVYTLSWLENMGVRSQSLTIKADQNLEVKASYGWSHVLLSPLLWPFYALLVLLLVHRWLTSRLRRTEDSSSKTSDLAVNDRSEKVEPAMRYRPQGPKPLYFKL